MSESLFYFTHSYPFGIGETWKEYEIEIFTYYYSCIHVCPFTYAGNYVPQKLPTNAVQHNPLTNNSIRKIDVLKLPFSENLFYYLKELINQKVYRSRFKFKKWVIASLQAEIAWKSEAVKDVLAGSKCVTLYFFWGVEWAYIIPLLRSKGFSKLFVRFHGYDLYEDLPENKGYIPYRSQILESVNTALVLTDLAEKYLRRKYHSIDFKAQVSPLGTRERGSAFPSQDGVLRLISCSYIVPVKRLSLIVSALQFATIAVEWTHIGDGPQMSEITSGVKKLPRNVTVNLVGSLEPRQITNFYHNNILDLFINVSASEGLPVSIMEAFSAGIPAIATDVGGTNILVNDKTGLLVPEDITPEELWSSIYRYYQLDADDKEKRRRNAYMAFKSSFSADDNARKLGQYLSMCDKQQVNNLRQV